MMGWYRRSSRLIFDAFRRYSSKNTAGKPIQGYWISRSCHVSKNITSFKPKPSFDIWRFSQPINCRNAWFRSSRFIFDDFRCYLSKKNITTSYLKPIPSLDRWMFSQPINCRNAWFQECISSSNFFINGISGGALIARRFLLQEVSNFIKQRRYLSRRNVSIAILVAYGVIISIYYLCVTIVNESCLETVPYTKRSRVLLADWETEKERGYEDFEMEKANFGDKVLPCDHPQSIRVRGVAQNIIKALNRDLKTEKVRTTTSTDDNIVNLHSSKPPKTSSPEKLNELGDKNISDGDDIEILDDQSIEGLEWEFIVVDEPTVNAHCFPGGKVVVFTGLLDHLTSDAEIATVIGHEVAHVVARHAVEMFSKIIWWSCLPPFIFIPFLSDIMFCLLQDLFEMLPYASRFEIEADHIGMLLMASAGYDPRVASHFYDKIAEIKYGLPFTHSFCERRARLLAQTKGVKEAVCLYREAQLMQALLFVGRNSPATISTI